MIHTPGDGSVHPAYKRTIFRDPEQQAFFTKFGYVITPYLDAAELAELNGLFEQTVRKAHETYSTFSQLRYYISVFDSDSSKRKALDGRVKGIFGDKVDRLMVDHRILLCNFMAKPPGAGEIEVHQDFSFVFGERLNNSCDNCHRKYQVTVE